MGVLRNHVKDYSIYISKGQMKLFIAPWGVKEWLHISHIMKSPNIFVEITDP